MPATHTQHPAQGASCDEITTARFKHIAREIIKPASRRAACLAGSRRRKLWRESSTAAPPQTRQTGRWREGSELAEPPFEDHFRRYVQKGKAGLSLLVLQTAPFLPGHEPGGRQQKPARVHTTDNNMHSFVARSLKPCPPAFSIIPLQV
jgi:hypothetical protein